MRIWIPVDWLLIYTIRMNLPNKLWLFRLIILYIGSYKLFVCSSITDGLDLSKVSCTSCLDQYQHFRDLYEVNNDLQLMCKRVALTRDCLATVQKYIRRCRSNIQLQVFRMGFKLEIKRYNCDKINITLPESRTGLPLLIKTTPKVKTQAERCQYKKSKSRLHKQSKADDIGFASRHCGLFGDPHLRTFSAQNQTCVVDGAWPLYNSMYLAVQVTNVKLAENPRVTATKKITVLIKNDPYSNCVEQKIYQVTAGFVPTIFRDGTHTTGPIGCQTKIIEESNGIRLEICHINTTIVIRQVGKYLTFGMNIPDELHNSHDASGLCVNGCPKSELIDYKHFFELQHPNSIETKTVKHPMTNKEAFLFCEKANLTDFYFDSCLFDLMTTGDEQFASSAQTAMDDALLLNPKLQLTKDNSVALSKRNNFLSGYYDQIYMKSNSPSSAIKISKQYLLILVVTIFSYTLLSWTI